MTLSLANHEASLPIAYRLYLPEDWAKDRARRDKARVPETMAFQTKPEIAFEQIKAAQAAGLPPGVVLMDAGYGNDTRLRTDITALGLSYMAGIGPNTSVWPPGMAPLPPQPRTGQGRPQKRLQRDVRHPPIAVKALALSLPAEAGPRVAWRKGSADWLASRFTLHADAAAAAAGAPRQLADQTAPRRMAADRVAGRQNRSRPSIGLPPCPRISPSIVWSTWPNCGGGSNAISKSSSRNSALVMMKGAGGAVSTIMPHSVSPLMAS